jgi:hypothetical protein
MRNNVKNSMRLNVKAIHCVGNVNDDADINNPWETVKKNIKISAKLS